MTIRQGLQRSYYKYIQRLKGKYINKKHIGNLSIRELETIKKVKMEILELESTLTEIKHLIDGPKSRLEKTKSH